MVRFYGEWTAETIKSTLAKAAEAIFIGKIDCFPFRTALKVRFYGEWRSPSSAKTSMDDIEVRPLGAALD